MLLACVRTTATDFDDLLLPAGSDALAVDRELEVTHTRDEHRGRLHSERDIERAAAQQVALQPRCNPGSWLPVAGVKQASVKARVGACSSTLGVPARDIPCRSAPTTVCERSLQCSQR